MTTMAAKTDTGDQPKSSGLLVQLLVLIGMTVFAAGAGWAVSAYFVESVDHRQESADEAAVATEPHVASGGEHGAADIPDNGAKAGRITALTSVKLEPIITNIADPKDTWIRLELAVQFESAPEQSTVDLVTEDLLTFVRTLRLEEISGPSGFLHFKSDLAERAAIRSEGKAKSVLIKVLLFE